MSKTFKHQLSQETRQKISLSLLGNSRAKGNHFSHTSEAKLKISEWHKNRNHLLFFKLKSCGKRHSFCKICNPKRAYKITQALWGDGNRDKTLQARSQVDYETASVKRLSTFRKNMSERKPTVLEFALQLLLEDAGFEYEAQKQYGRYCVDFWVPEYRLVFEADGSFWYHHQDIEREAKRDEYLLRQGAIGVVHFDEKDLSPWCL